MCSSKVHCHNCPLPPGNIECSQRVIEDPDTAVKMVCSNVQCNRSGLLHARCFDRLEKHLLKALAATSMGKKWTEAQLKANVWNCRGIHSLHKFSKCSCGGTLGRGEEEHKAFVPAAKKKEKMSQKPKLNCDGVKISYSEMKMFQKVAEEKAHAKASPEKFVKIPEIVFEIASESSRSSDIERTPVISGALRLSPITSAPQAASISAVARPMPLDAPQTTALIPFSASDAYGFSIFSPQST